MALVGKAGLVVLISLLAIAAHPKNEREIGKPETSQKAGSAISGTLGLVLDIGSTVISAVQAFYEIQEIKQAKLLVNVNNLSKWALGNTQIRVLAGETTDVPNIVLPGYTEAIAANQDGTKNRFTQGYVAFDAAPGFYCIFYWYIEGSAKVTKQGNSLGVGVMLENKTIENHNILFDINQDTLSNDYMNFGSFQGSQDSIRYCTTDFCIYGIAGSSHQPEMNIDIIPRRAEDLAAELFEKNTNQNVTQEMLDNLLRDDGNCKIDCIKTSEPVNIKSIFDWKNLYKLSPLGDKVGFVIMMVWCVGASIGFVIMSSVYCCCRSY